jgi:hypothetical protein
MKRWLLPASALVLVVTACGAGTRPAPRVTEVGAQVPTVHALVVRRERAALRQARAVLGKLAVPPGARRDPAKRDHGGILHQSGRAPFGETVAAHRFWKVHEPLPAVVAFLRAHDPSGFRRAGSGSGTQKPNARTHVPAARYLARTLAWPAHDREPTRFLDETVAELPGRTVVRVEASVAWTYPRSPREQVPPATREIVLRSPNVSVEVKDPAKVARIVRWFDALPISPPGIGLACALSVRARATLSFRSRAGTQLAAASVPLGAASVCDPIGFAIAGRHRRPLIDEDHGRTFVRRLQRLLGVRLVETHR